MSDELRKVKVKKKKRLGFNWFFWISLVIILVPVIYFGILLLQAAGDTHTPIIGDRIKNTIAYEIEDSAVSEIKSQISALDGVESCEVNLIVETLRITVNGQDGKSADEYKQLAESIYNIVDARLPIADYFTRTDDYKQYDLEINIYDNFDSEEPILVTLNKNGAMEEYEITVLSEPLNPDLAYQLTHPEEQNTDPVLPVEDDEPNDDPDDV